MPVPIPRPNAQHYLGRTQFVEPGFPGGAPGPVVPALEQGHRPDAATEQRLHRQARVAGEHRAEAAVPDQQDDRVLIQVEAGAFPARRRMQHAEDHAIELERLARARRQPAAAILTRRDQEVEVGPIGNQRCRLDHERRPERANHRFRPTEVVEVGVTHDEGGQPARTTSPKCRRHHPTPGVATPIKRPRIDQDPATAGGAEGNGVALPHIQKM